MPDEPIVGQNPAEPRPLRPTAVSVEDSELGKKVTKRAKRVLEDQKSGEDIESITLEKDGREFTIAKSIYDLEMSKPEKREEIKEGEPVLLRHPDLVGAKVVK